MCMKTTNGDKISRMRHYPATGLSIGVLPYVPIYSPWTLTAPACEYVYWIFHRDY